MCPRCAELENELAYLRSELGLQIEPTQIDNLVRAFDIGRGDARLLMVLYLANGRTATRWQILESLPPLAGLAGIDARNVSVVKLRVCRLRKVLPADSILTVWGYGYRLSPEGRACIETALQARRAVAA